MPFHSSHEHFVPSHVPGGILLRNGWSVSFDDETINVIQQFEASTLQSLIRQTSYGGRSFVRLGMVPHPRPGLTFFGLVRARGISVPTRRLTIPDLSRSGRKSFPRDRAQRSHRVPPSDLPQMNPSGNFSGCWRLVPGRPLVKSTYCSVADAHAAALRRRSTRGERSSGSGHRGDKVMGGLRGSLTGAAHSTYGIPSSAIRSMSAPTAASFFSICSYPRSR